MKNVTSKKESRKNMFSNYVEKDKYHHHPTQYIPLIEKNYGQGLGRDGRR